jgi:hypothetical protein
LWKHKAGIIAGHEQDDSMNGFPGRAQTGGTIADHGLTAALPPGTEILTLAGALPVEALYPGDRVITRDAGAQRLVSITRHPVPANMRFVQVSRDALGGKPTREMLLPGSQPVLLRDWRAKALFGTPAARVPLSRLVDGDHLRWSEIRPEALLTLRLAHVHVIYADGLELFSAEPAPATA